MSREILIVAIPVLTVVYANEYTIAPAGMPAAQGKSAAAVIKSLESDGTDDPLEQAARLQEQGQARAAHAVLTDAFKANDKRAELRSGLAWSHLYIGEPEPARRLFIETRASDLDLLGLALAERGRGNLKAAQHALELLIEKRPKLAAAHYYLGEVLTLLGRKDDAISAFQRALKEDSHFAEARPPMAELFEKKGQFDEAWKHHSKILHVSPSNAAARSGQERLLPLLTRKPEEIIPTYKIVKHSALSPRRAGLQGRRIRVGIGTGLSGAPARRMEVSFRSSGPFSIIDAASGRKLASANPFQAWTIRMSQVRKDAGEILNAAGKKVASFSEPIVARPENRGRNTFILSGLTYAYGFSWGGMSDKELRGDLMVRIDPAQGTLVLINETDLDAYLYGVLLSEMPGHFPEEALKAQAVIARTQALYRQSISRPHKAFGFDVCEGQHCQVYGGVRAETPKARQAVDQTADRVLRHRGRFAHTIFFSNCGGHTQSGREIGWADLPYWSAVSDSETRNPARLSEMGLRKWLQDDAKAYCSSAAGFSAAPEFRWTRVIKARDLETRIASKERIGKIVAVVPTKRSLAGYVGRLEIRGTEGTVVLDKEHEIRRFLGLAPIRSNLFVIDTFYSGEYADRFLLFGGGWGHGVGLCQAGAAGRAKSGAAFAEILSHYYAGASLEDLDEEANR